jgi:hypothetical protein
MLTPWRLKSPYALDLAQSLSNVELLFPVSVSFFFRRDHWMFVLSLGFLFYTLLGESKYPRRVVVALQNSYFIVIELIIQSRLKVSLRVAQKYAFLLCIGGWY